METKFRYLSQMPKPVIQIFSFKNGKESLVWEFSPYKTDNDRTDALQSYSFKYSTGDVDGSFSLTFHPGRQEKNLFDIVKPLQIVKIFERDEGLRFPDFVGVINKRKYTAQSNGNFRINVVGKSVASFVSRFKIDLDLNAMAITNELVSQEALDRELTEDLSKTKKTLSEILSKIWKHATDAAESHLQLSNSTIKKYVDRYLGTSFFSIENNEEFLYPLASVFNGHNTINFWDIVSGIIPYPVYEKFACIDAEGDTKIKIRQVPFLCSGDNLGEATWDKLPCKKLPAALIKGFELEQSDDEVYTAFFSYINGSPIDSDKALRLSAQANGYSSSDVTIFAEKASLYGYSPLTVRFNGYGKSEKDYSGSEESLRDNNEKLMAWYGRVDEMLRGTIVMSTWLREQMPMCGERIAFLGGQFYVEEVEHTWSYGANPETKLTVSRGGDYSANKFAPLLDITRQSSIFE